MNPKAMDDKLNLLLEWKRLYSEAAIKALNPSGNVLQIGFGSGIAAEAVQRHRPKSHLIIEPDPRTYAEAKKWSEKHPGTSIISGGWEKILPSLPAFDAVYFNAYSTEFDSRILNFLFSETTNDAAAEVKKVLDQIEQQMATVTSKFSDTDIEDFYRKVGSKHPQELQDFFLKLRDNGNITKAQYENALKKYGSGKPGKAHGPAHEWNVSSDPMLAFLKECLKGHLAKGGRFSSFLPGQTSKYDDSQFFDEIITNAGIDYKETSVPLKMSDKTRDALIMILEKT